MIHFRSYTMCPRWCYHKNCNRLSFNMALASQYGKCSTDSTEFLSHMNVRYFHRNLSVLRFRYIALWSEFFWHYRSQAVRTIMFNTRTYLGRNAAVMIAWILLSCVTVAVFSWYMRRYDESNAEAPYRPPSLKISSDKEVDKIIEEEKR